MSREDEQHEVVTALATLWAEYPNWRLGQLIANVAVWTRGVDKSALWEMEDKEALKAIINHLDKKKSR